MDPWYWAYHLRQTVQFATGVRTLLEHPHTLVLEVGPGQSLIGLIGQHPSKKATHTLVPLCRHPKDHQTDSFLLKQALGRAWLAGVPVVWKSQESEGARKRRLPLPTYPFEKKRHWVERATSQLTHVPAPLFSEAVAEQKRNLDVFRLDLAQAQSNSWLVMGNIPGGAGPSLEEAFTRQDITIFNGTGMSMTEACQKYQEKYGRPPARMVYLVPENGDLIDLEKLVAQFKQFSPQVISQESLQTSPDGAETTGFLPASGEASTELSQSSSSQHDLTTLEQQIVHIWEELFGIHPINLHDDFFELGGHSLMAIQLMTVIRETFGLEIDLESMFDDPTVAGLIKQVAQTQTSETEH